MKLMYIMYSKKINVPWVLRDVYPTYHPSLNQPNAREKKLYFPL